jgi:thiol-disulfide isomerase/thioredoxin
VSTEHRTRSERRREARRERRNPSRPSIWRGPGPIVGAVVLIAGAIAAFVFLSQQSASTTNADATAIAASVTSISPTTLESVGAGTLSNPLQSTGATALLKGPSGKPVVIYVGAEFCPFCASERWSLIVALSRFGTFRGLGLTRSSATDVYPNTPTFTFRGSSYTSDVVEFAPVETQDRDKNPLDTPSALQDGSLKRYDQQGSIPYLSIADRYVEVGSGYPPDALAGKTWQQVADQLRDPTSTVARAVLGNANFITAAICDVTANAPASVCDSAVLRALPKPK